MSNKERDVERERILLERAHAANAADHALTWWQAMSKYRKAVFWACVFSFTLTMQSSDATSVSGPYNAGSRSWPSSTPRGPGPHLYLASIYRQYF